MKKLLCVALFAVTCGLAAADDNKTKPDDKAKPADAAALNGTYAITSGEEEGKAVPKERIEGAMIIFTDKTVAGTDKDKKEFFSATYALDTSKSPWAITMTNASRGAAPAKDDKKPAEAMTSAGLIKVDGDTVTIIYALPGGKPPTEFKTGDKQQMFVMKRTEKKDK
jgi:uncharacterized protein (TIGR03067 family)